MIRSLVRFKASLFRGLGISMAQRMAVQVPRRFQRIAARSNPGNIILDVEEGDLYFEGYIYLYSTPACRDRNGVGVSATTA